MLTKPFAVALLALCCVSAPAQTSSTQTATRKPATQRKTGAATTKPKTAAAPALKDLKDKASYAMGLNMGLNMRRQMMEIDPELLAVGLRDGYNKNPKPLMSEDEANAALMQMDEENRQKAAQRQAQAASTNLATGQGFLLANKSQPGVVTLPSGLQYKVLVQGTGPKPGASDTVACNYRGTFIDGTEFDSSAKAGHPITFPVNGVIKGWTEALQLMPVGSKWQLFIPPNLAYGERGRPGIPPNSTLVFDVELVSIQPKQ
jgi:FKBP-type peptidyl-prolyl cis-trans isomerase FklB